MLTESEKRWLHDRLNGCFFAYCRPWCPQFDACKSHTQKCPTRENIKSIKEAADFEQRVAAKMAEFYHHTTLYLDDSDGQKLRCWETCPARFYCGDSYTHLTCGNAVLKTAQLAVEEEMDGEAK